MVANRTDSLGGLIGSHVNRDQSRPSTALETHREETASDVTPVPENVTLGQYSRERTTKSSRKSVKTKEKVKTPSSVLGYA